jgi:hypothetical protein
MPELIPPRCAARLGRNEQSLPAWRYLCARVKYIEARG